MALLFVVGAMSTGWAALIALYVLAERLVPRAGVLFDRAAGAGLALFGLWLMIGGPAG